jgi:hypothetical protein
MKFKWKKGENEYQNYYDTRTPDGKYLLVFANKTRPDMWMAMVDGIMVYNKTANDRERKKLGLAKGCRILELSVIHVLTNKDPEYMMKKAEYCYRHNQQEISA